MLKDHYLVEDYESMITQIENIFKAGTKAVEIAEKAEFSAKDELLAEMSTSLENLMMLHRRKIDHDVSKQAQAYVGIDTYV